MRVNAISVSTVNHMVKNKNVQVHHNVQSEESKPQQNVSFQGNNAFKLGLGALGGILGGLVIGGPVGAIIGAAAGLKGAQLVEAEDEAENNEKSNKPGNNK